MVRGSPVGLLVMGLAVTAAVGARLPDSGSGQACGATMTAGPPPPTVTFTFFRHRSIDGPVAITAGPDRALWFTTNADDPSEGSGAIGRITSTGKVTFYRHKSYRRPGRDHDRP